MSRQTRLVLAMAVVVSFLVVSVAMIANAQKAGPAKTAAVGAAARAPGGQGKTATQKPPAGSTKCPMCGMTSGKMAKCDKGGMPISPQAMMQQCMGMMRQAGVSEEMMRRCQVMIKTPIFLDSPCAVFGQAKSLGLSDAQKKRLATIEKESREKAMAVLTPEQRNKMGKIPPTPMAMGQVCQQMCGKMMPMMQKMMGGKMGKSMMMCPMMQMTGGKKAPEGSGKK